MKNFWLVRRQKRNLAKIAGALEALAVAKQALLRRKMKKI
jgi:hypothetical protein